MGSRLTSRCAPSFVESDLTAPASPQSEFVLRFTTVAYRPNAEIASTLMVRFTLRSIRIDWSATSHRHWLAAMELLQSGVIKNPKQA